MTDRDRILGGPEKDPHRDGWRQRMTAKRRDVNAFRGPKAQHEESREDRREEGERGQGT